MAVVKSSEMGLCVCVCVCARVCLDAGICFTAGVGVIFRDCAAL